MASARRAVLPVIVLAICTTVRASDVSELLSSLSPSQKVGQLLVIGIEGTRLNKAQRRILEDIEPGGVVIFGRNVRDPLQVHRLLMEINKTLSDVPPFLATDQEGGAVVRLKKGALVFPGAMLLGAAGDPELALRAGIATGRDLARLGFNVNMAPVLDVNSRAGNPVIGIRSFSDDPEVVGTLGTAFASGLLKGGVLPVAKHFPGHGDTLRDSHGSLPTLPHDLHRLMRVELIPFKKVMAEGVCPIIMTAHVALPALEPDRAEVPATLSRAVVTDLLRKRLKFGGVVITDDLGMAALAPLPVGEAAVRALEAGADMLLLSRGGKAQLKVKNSVLEALQSGRLTWERIEESVKRVLELKSKFGILSKETKADFSRRPSKRDKRLVLDVAGKGVTLVWNRKEALPVKKGEKVLVFSQSATFSKDLEKLLPGVEGWHLSYRLSGSSAAELVDEALKGRGPDKVIVAVTNGHGMAVVDRLKQKTSASVILVSLGSPYLLAKAAWTDAGIAAYSFRWPACWAAARVVAGRLVPTGRLPVKIPGLVLGKDKHPECVSAGARRVSLPHVEP